MGHESAAPPGSRYQDQRRYVLTDSLAELRGPTHGTVTLDPWLDWSGSPTYELDDQGDLLVLYQTVLHEAITANDLRRWLNGATLRRLWSSLWLPPRLRSRWESRFPELSTRPRPAAT